MILAVLVESQWEQEKIWSDLPSGFFSTTQRQRLHQHASSELWRNQSKFRNQKISSTVIMACFFNSCFSVTFTSDYLSAVQVKMKWWLGKGVTSKPRGTQKISKDMLHLCLSSPFNLLCNTTLQSLSPLLLFFSSLVLNLHPSVEVAFFPSLSPSDSVCQDLSLETLFWARHSQMLKTGKICTQTPLREEQRSLLDTLMQENWSDVIIFISKSYREVTLL